MQWHMHFTWGFLLVFNIFRITWMEILYPYLHNDQADGDLHNDQTSLILKFTGRNIWDWEADSDMHNDQTAFDIEKYRWEHLELKLKSKLKLSNMWIHCM